MNRVERLRAECAAEAAARIERVTVAQSTGTVVSAPQLLGRTPKGPTATGAPCFRCGARPGCCNHLPAPEPVAVPEGPLSLRGQPVPQLNQRPPTGLEAEALAFIERHGMSRSSFCAQIGHSTNPRDGFFAKARDGRLKLATVEKVRRFMRDRDGGAHG